MKLEIPGQCKGRDAGLTMKSLVQIRKEFESLFDTMSTTTLKEITVILRVDGELGSFGEAGIENVVIKNKKAECDLVISAQNWNEMSENQIYTLLKPRIIDSLITLLTHAKIEIPNWLIKNNI